MQTTTRPLRTVQTAVLAALLLAAAAPALAASPEKQARHEMKIGFDAARHGYWQEALMRFQRADSLTPGQPHVLNNLAVALEATGDFEGALLTYEQAVQAAPGDRTLRENYEQFKKFYQDNLANPEPEDEAGGAEAPAPAAGDDTAAGGA